jgi:hypothetical protein
MRDGQAARNVLHGSAPDGSQCTTREVLRHVAARLPSLRICVRLLATQDAVSNDANSMYRSCNESEAKMPNLHTIDRNRQVERKRKYDS